MMRWICGAICLAVAAIALAACDGGFRPSEEGREPETVVALPADPADMAAVRATAESFLSKIDQGRFAETWPEMAELVKKQSSAEKWAATAQEVAKTTGPLVGRTEKSLTFTDRLKKAPVGKYFVHVYDSVFKQVTAQERIVTVFEDGQWKIAGYNLFEIRRVVPSG